VPSSPLLAQFLPGPGLSSIPEPAAPELDPALYAHIPPSLCVTLERPERPLVPAPVLPSLVQLLHAGDCDLHYTADLVASARLAGERNDFIAAGNSICGVPQDLIGYCLSMGQLVFPAAGSRSLRQEDESGITGRIFAFPDEMPMREPFVEGMVRFASKEQSYFANFSENPIYSFSVEQGLTDIDMSQFREDQRRIFLDVIRKTYLSKYFAKVEDRVRDDAWRFSQWQGADFIVGPPLIAAYAWLRGIDRKIPIIGELKLRVSVEPLQRIREYDHDREHNLIGATTLELGLSSFPVKAVCSFGLHHGDPTMDFVGIGTSVGEAKKVISMTYEIEEPESLR
jgi:hypothetical protein